MRVNAPFVLLALSGTVAASSAPGSTHAGIARRAGQGHRPAKPRALGGVLSPREPQGGLGDVLGDLLGSFDNQSTTTTTSDAPRPTKPSSSSGDEDATPKSTHHGSSSASDDDGNATPAAHKSSNTSSNDDASATNDNSTPSKSASSASVTPAPQASGNKADGDDTTTTSPKEKDGLLEGLGNALDSLLTGAYFKPTTTKSDDAEATPASKGDSSSTKGDSTKSDDDDGRNSSATTTSEAPVKTGLLGGLLGGVENALTSKPAWATHTPAPTSTKSDDDEEDAPRPTSSKGGLLDPILDPILNPITKDYDSSSTKDTPTYTKSSDDGESTPTSPSTTYDEPAYTKPASSEDTYEPTSTFGQSNGEGATSTAPIASPTGTALISDDGDASTSTKSVDEPTETATTKDYWWADTSSLIMPSATTAPSDDPLAASTASTSASVAVATHVNAAPQFPSTIVPADGALVQPDGTTAVSILMKDSLRWTWLASNADTTAQVLAFMPQIIANSVGIDPSQVITVRLQAFYPDANTPEDQARTLFMAYVPTAVASDLAADVKDPSSDFYVSKSPLTGVAQQLVANVDPSFDILSTVGGQLKGPQEYNTQSDGDSKATLRNALIGVSAALVAAIVAFFGWRAYRKKQKSKRPVVRLGRNATIRSFGGGNNLRETWAPSIAEQERVLHGQQLTQTWEASNGTREMQYHDNADRMTTYSTGAGSAGVEHGWGDPFVDDWAVTNRASHMTERSGESQQYQHNRDSAMTEAQRIQQEYIDAHDAPTDAHQSLVGIAYSDEAYHTPQQYGSTSSHSYGPRSTDNNRHRKRTSRTSSIGGASIGQPQMNSNSMMI